MTSPSISAVARYIDQLERDVKTLRPQVGIDFWHVMAGAITGGGAALFACVKALVQHAYLWPEIAAFSAVCALAFGIVGRIHWNGLLAGSYVRLRELARTNMLDHELLMLTLESDLPARYEKLRYVAQSRGKSRERNYAELRKGSMLDRLQWLVANYAVICAALGLPATLPELAARNRLLVWLMLSPLALFLGSIAYVMTPYGHAHVDSFPWLMLGSMAMMTLCMGTGTALSIQVSKIERSALASVLVELLDLTDPAPEAVPDSEAMVEAAQTQSVAAQRERKKET